MGRTKESQEKRRKRGDYGRDGERKWERRKGRKEKKKKWQERRNVAEEPCRGGLTEC